MTIHTHVVPLLSLPFIPFPTEPAHTRLILLAVSGLLIGVNFVFFLCQNFESMNRRIFDEIYDRYENIALPFLIALKAHDAIPRVIGCWSLLFISTFD